MTADDAERRHAAKQLRAEHPKWLVIWIARTQRFHAYLLASSRADAGGLTDPQPAGLAAQMKQAERAHALTRQIRRAETAQNALIRELEETGDGPAAAMRAASPS